MEIRLFPNRAFIEILVMNTLLILSKKVCS